MYYWILCEISNRKHSEHLTLNHSKIFFNLPPKEHKPLDADTVVEAGRGDESEGCCVREVEGVPVWD